MTEGKIVGLEGSFAIAEAVRMANTDVISAYPITPQTHIVERLAEMIADGELNAEFICVESEHSAMSACVGASAAGARVFTCSAGQGLELMHEVLYIPSSMRLPVVAVAANRALSGPLSVWCDHSDVMALRDIGWIQMFAENNQQAFDLTVCAYKIAEDKDVLFPTMVHIDGFYLSHVIEDMMLPDDEVVADFIPEYEHPFVLDPEKPVSMGCYGPPFIYPEAKKAQEVAFESTKSKILETWKEFEDTFGRHYAPVETYKMEDASIALLTMGSISETAMLTVDELRAEGQDVGLIRLRLWRPFPFTEFRDAVKDVELLVVLDRAISFGMGGPVCSEVKSALYDKREDLKIVGFIAGIGGRDITIADFKYMINRAAEKAKVVERGEDIATEMIGVRE
ncbi:MAG: transketolase C-terminal domain-containing protein [Euryarchaeota archaeon]|nr:transketolase C-terminal domain-containing protein [Euryarchaeota archaeon]